jgi:hypothetical protein
MPERLTISPTGFSPLFSDSTMRPSGAIGERLESASSTTLVNPASAVPDVELRFLILFAAILLRQRVEAMAREIERYSAERVKTQESHSAQIPHELHP